MRTPPRPIGESLQPDLTGLFDPTGWFDSTHWLPTLTVDIEEIITAAGYTDYATEAAALARLRLLPLLETLRGCGEPDVGRAGAETLTTIAEVLDGLGQALGGHALSLADAATTYAQTEQTVVRAPDASLQSWFGTAQGAS